jgi:hypothetical protein
MDKALETSKRIWNAMQTEDMNVLAAAVHPDAVFVHMGVTLSRDAEMDVIKEKQIVYKAVEYQEVTTKDYGATIVLLNKLKLTAVVGGNEVVNPFVVTEVYTKEGAERKLASMSYTRIIY